VVLDKLLSFIEPQRNLKVLMVTELATSQFQCVRSADQEIVRYVRVSLPARNVRDNHHVGTTWTVDLVTADLPGAEAESGQIKELRVCVLITVLQYSTDQQHDHQ
jgi:hypothetical protein